MTGPPGVVAALGVGVGAGSAGAGADEFWDCFVRACS